MTHTRGGGGVWGRAGWGWSARVFAKKGGGENKTQNIPFFFAMAKKKSKEELEAEAKAEEERRAGAYGALASCEGGLRALTTSSCAQKTHPPLSPSHLFPSAAEEEAERKRAAAAAAEAARLEAERIRLRREGASGIAERGYGRASRCDFRAHTNAPLPLLRAPCPFSIPRAEIERLAEQQEEVGARMSARAKRLHDELARAGEHKARDAASNARGPSLPPFPLPPPPAQPRPSARPASCPSRSPWT